MADALPEMLAADRDGIGRAAALLRDGALVAVPTETVYGLAARADREAAVAGIYRAKERPEFNPLIVHVGTLDQARALGVIDERAEVLARQFWPGPLTLVVPLLPGAEIVPAVTAGLPTIALRMPDHPVLRRLLVELGAPVAAPSANRSGAVSPTRPDHVAASLGNRVRAIVDGGACVRGVESTIIALRGDGGWDLLRPGPIAPAEIEPLLGPARQTAGDRVEAPGQLASHYSPGKPLRLDAQSAAADEFMIGFGRVQGACSLSETGDLAQAAARLYQCLHLAASAPQPRVAVAPVPSLGLGEAINDRLRRAAA